MAKAKTTKASKPAPTRKKAPKAPPKPATPAQAASEPPPDTEGGYRLADAAERLGAPSPALERAVRAAHTDSELHAEGIRVASDRILADGERLCSKALVHLESKDDEVQRVARKAGLTRPLVALTVDALRRLQGEWEQAQGDSGKQAGKRRTAVLTVEAATARGRALKRQTLERLEMVKKADDQLRGTIAKAATRATKPEQLAAQLATLGKLVKALPGHKSEAVRELAQAKALGDDDAAELAQASEDITQAAKQVTPGNTAAEEKQALLDVLDGLCLVLLDDVLRALRAMARATSKVRKPTLYNLQSYFGSRGKAEEEPEAPPAPPS